MSAFRILCHENPHGKKYYPQVRRWLRWHDILPIYGAACGTVREARGVIYNCAGAEDAKRVGAVVECLLGDRRKWPDMAPAQEDPGDRWPAHRNPFMPLYITPDYVQPTEAWPRADQPAGVFQPDPYVLAPWFLRGLLRLLDRWEARQIERKRRLEKLEHDVDRLVADAVAIQTGIRHRPKRRWWSTP